MDKDHNSGVSGSLGGKKDVSKRKKAESGASHRACGRAAGGGDRRLVSADPCAGGGDVLFPERRGAGSSLCRHYDGGL